MAQTVQFVCKAATAFGEKVRVVGGVAWLGSWTPIKGLELAWSNDSWKGAAVVSAEQAKEWAAAAIEFKFVVEESHGGFRCARLPSHVVLASFPNNFNILFYRVRVNRASEPGRVIAHFAARIPIYTHC